MSSKSPYSGPTCRGALALGTGCGGCEKCRDERAVMGGSFPLRHKAKKLGDDAPMQPLHDPEFARLQELAARERRERIATAAMTGYIAMGEYEDWQISGLAFDMADRMIAELDKGKAR